MSEKIRITCEGAGALPVGALTHFQGELKSLDFENYERLKKMILDHGFSEPISVWKGSKENYILNGHQRLRTVKQMLDDGYELEDDIPISYVEAKDVNEAKRKVLALTSQYGRVEKQGLYEFMQDTDMTVAELGESFRFPELNLGMFEQEYFSEIPPELPGNELSEDLANQVSMAKCPECGHEFPK